RIVDTNEVLLYDFSILPGDSLKLGIDTTFYYRVDSITTEIVSDSLRKKYWISQDDFYWTETWIEGVGSNKGIIGSAMASAVGGWSWLLCMSDVGNLIYMNPDFGSCYINTGLKEMSNPVISIYPNPAQNEINCVLPENGAYEIVVYNALGSIVHPSTPLRMTIKSGVYQINISELPHGIYFIEARGERVLRGKFIKH
ncbi:MAG TPA: T9SS type A sorting domain-containing protein, partial [Bacteroidales bacterium]|nr:T9SS type A sorting domain-containing protein [Bacteroidales bacterium]